MDSVTIDTKLSMDVHSATPQIGSPTIPMLGHSALSSHRRQASWCLCDPEPVTHPQEQA